jgi:hypothetical protein
MIRSMAFGLAAALATRLPAKPPHNRERRASGAHEAITATYRDRHCCLRGSHDWTIDTN